MAQFRAAKRPTAWTGMLLVSAAAALLMAAAPLAAVAASFALPPQAPAEDSTQASAWEALQFGKQQRTKKNEITVPLEFTSSEQELPNRIHAEIELAEGPWRFQKGQAPTGSPLKISVRQRSEKRTTESGGDRRVTIFSVEISAGKGTISTGPVGELVFLLRPPESAEAIPLLLDEVEVSRGAKQAPPMLEPPPGEPGMSPSTGCFVFSH